MSIPPLQSSAHPSLQRRATLSLGYDEAYNSNEGMKHLPLTTIQGYSWVFDQATKMTSGFWSRLALIGADVVLHMPYLGKEFVSTDTCWLFQEKWWPYLPAYHEFGHARAIRAFAPKKFKHYKVAANGSETYEEPSVIWYYIHCLKQLAHVDEAETHYNLCNLKNYTHNLLIYAGGLNNETLLAKEISERIYRFNGHIAYFGAYLRSKLGPVTYTAKTIAEVVPEDVGDVNYIVNYYKSYNPGFDLRYIQYGGWISLLCSSSTYAFIKGYWYFVHTGNPIVTPMTWNGLRLPDINAYFTRNGLSLEVVTGYQITPNFWFNLGVETVYYPGTSMEFTPSLRYAILTQTYGAVEFEVGGVFNSYLHMSGHVGIEWTDPDKVLTLEAKLIHHNANTYVGERNIPFAFDGDHYFEFMLAGAINY